jgi:hypothetical protein
MKNSFSICFSTSHWSGRRVSNPQPPAWKAGALPIELLPLLILQSGLYPNSKIWSSGVRWIRTTEDEVSRFTVCPIWPLWYYPKNKKRAEEGTRTPDQLITNQLLYQLSYSGFFVFYKELPPKKGIAKVIILLNSTKNY